MYLDLEDLMLDPFWNNQDEMLNTWHMINNHSCVPIVYGRATEAEAHARPTTDLLKTFRGPFKDIMQSKAMRWISQEDLDKHNYKAKQLAIEWFVLDPTLQGTKLDWLGFDLKRYVARFAFMPKETSELFVRDFLVLEYHGGPYKCGLWPKSVQFDIRVAGCLDGWCISEAEARQWFCSSTVNAQLANPILIPKNWPDLCVQVCCCSP